jgi:hypothetical protein
MTEISKRIIESVDKSLGLSFGKMGSVEASCLIEFLAKGQNRNWDTPGHGRTLRLAAAINAGVFPPEDAVLDKWCEAYLSSVQDLDYVLEWCPEYGDRQIIDKFCYRTEKFFSFGDYEPFFMKENNWLQSLNNSRVLVVSPFSETIKHQFDRFDEVWNSEVKFESLEVLKAPYSPFVSGGSEYNDYFHALSDMQMSVLSTDFDIAIVGAGAYSLPLMKTIKMLGKTSIHLGGATQLCFGIKGGRWNQDNNFANSEFYNRPSWIKPLETDIPKNNTLVENGCYW